MALDALEKAVHAADGNDYVSRQVGLRKFRNLYMGWVNGLVHSEAHPSTVFVRGFGLAGKTSFIKHDVAGCFTDERHRLVKDGTYTPILIHVDYATVGKDQSQAAIVEEIGKKLHAAGVATPRLDYGLNTLGRVPLTVDSKRQMDLDVAEQVTNAAGYLNDLMAALNKIPAEVSSYLAGLIGGVGLTVSVSKMLCNALSRADHTRQLIDSMGKGQLESLLYVLLVADLGPKGLVLTKNGTQTLVCIALDGIGGAEGVADGDWELEFAKTFAGFAIVSARSFPWDPHAGFVGDAQTYEEVTIDLDEVDASAIDSLVKHSGIDNLDDNMREFLYHGGGDNGPVSMGVAGILLSTLSMHGRAESKALQYAKTYMAKERGLATKSNRKVATREITRNILAIQLGNVDDKVARTVYAMSWFDSVDPKWVMAQFSITDEALDDASRLPYVVVDSQDEWYVHDLVAHFARLECPLLLAEKTESILSQSVTKHALPGESSKNCAIRKAIARIRARTYYADISRTLSDAEILSLPDPTANEGLQVWWHLTRWSTLQGDSAIGFESCINTFDNLVRALLEWNKSTRGIGSKGVSARGESYVSVLRDYSFQFGVRFPTTRETFITSLIYCGAIESDVYRYTSDIKHHHKAFALEREALHLIVDEKKSPYDRRVADALNSVAVSSYRLHGYEFSLVLHAMTVKVVRTMRKDLAIKGCLDEKDIKNDEDLKSLEARLLRTWVATMFACGLDMEGQFKSVPLLDIARDDLLKEGTAVASKAADLEPGRAWDVLMTKAECNELLKNYNEAIIEHETVLRQIDGHLNNPSAFVIESKSRCEYLLARVLQERKKDGDLEKALGHARTSLFVRYRTSRRGTDTVKSYRLVTKIEKELGDVTIEIPTDQEEVLREADENLRGLKGDDTAITADDRELSWVERWDIYGLIDKMRASLCWGDDKTEYKKIVDSIKNDAV